MVLSPKSTSRGWTTFAFICLRSTLLIVVTFFYFQHIDRIGHWINPVVETPTWGETIEEVSSLARRSTSTNLQRLLLGSGKWVYYYHSLVPTLIRNLCAFRLLPFSTISFLFIFLANHLALVPLASIFLFSLTLHLQFLSYHLSGLVFSSISSSRLPGSYKYFFPLPHQCYGFYFLLLHLFRNNCSSICLQTPLPLFLSPLHHYWNLSIIWWGVWSLFPCFPIGHF